MAGKLDGRVAIVTGASSGIGEATAEALAAEGAAVVAAAQGGPARAAITYAVTQPERVSVDEILTARPNRRTSIPRNPSSSGAAIEYLSPDGSS